MFISFWYAPKQLRIHVVFAFCIFFIRICVFCGMGAHLCRCLETCGVKQEATIEDNEIDVYICYIQKFEAFFLSVSVIWNLVYTCRDCSHLVLKWLPRHWHMGTTIGTEHNLSLWILDPFMSWVLLRLTNNCFPSSTSFPLFLMSPLKHRPDQLFVVFSFGLYYFEMTKANTFVLCFMFFFWS